MRLAPSVAAPGTPGAGGGNGWRSWRPCPERHPVAVPGTPARVARENVETLEILETLARSGSLRHGLAPAPGRRAKRVKSLKFLRGPAPPEASGRTVAKHHPAHGQTGSRPLGV